MKGYILNLEKETIGNSNYRKVLYTSNNLQLVLMCLMPGDEIGEEIHELDQFIRIEEGEGQAILNDVGYGLSDGMAVIIPQGVKHNIVNTGEVPLKLYSVYSPPEHKDKTVHVTKQDEKEEHFDGVTTE